VVRRLNAAQLRRRAAELEAGDARALVALQAGGIARDLVRALVLTGFTLAVGERVARHVEIGWRAPRPVADVAVVGTALGVAMWSAYRLFGQGAPRRWFATGAVAGVAVVAGLLAW
jgi:hypothetical protein